MTTEDTRGWPDGYDPLEELATLRDRAELQLEGLKATQEEISALVALPDAVAVVAVFDQKGLLESLAIDAESAAGMDGVSLTKDVNLAFARAERPRVGPPAEHTSGAEDAASAFVSSVFQAVLSGMPAEPVRYRNDLGTVTVTSMWGELVAVECSTSWIESASPSSVADEILRVVNLALIEDDPAGPTQGERLMSDDFRVNPDSLDRDATTWGAWSSDLEGLRDSIPTLGTGLDPLAFSILPNAQQVAAAYNSATRALVDSLDDGIGQFDGIATKLGDSATAYREAESLNVDDIAAANAALEDLA